MAVAEVLPSVGKFIKLYPTLTLDIANLSLVLIVMKYKIGENL